jgi:hypothetical protein
MSENSPYICGFWNRSGANVTTVANPGGGYITTVTNPI